MVKFVRKEGTTGDMSDTNIELTSSLHLISLL
jgi:hypothetical protein